MHRSFDDDHDPDESETSTDLMDQLAEDDMLESLDEDSDEFVIGGDDRGLFDDPDEIDEDDED